MTVSQLALAWILSKGEEDIKEIEDAIPENEIAGASFPNMQFRNGKIVLG